MKEYIEREFVKEMLENAQSISDGEYCGYCTEDINVDDIPSADVREVVHARWHGKPIAGYSTVICTNCHAVYVENQGKWKYCPECGAKMDLEE